MAQLARMVDSGKINASTAPVIAEKMLASNDDPQTIAKRENLLQVSDTSAIEAIINQVITENSKAVEEAKEPGKKQQKALGFLLGQVMQKSRGQANPQIVSTMLKEKLKV